VSVFNKNTRRVLSYPMAAENGGYDQGGCVRGGALTSLRLRRITSSPSQTLSLRRCLVQTTDAAVSARRLLPFVAALFFTLRDSYG